MFDVEKKDSIKTLLLTLWKSEDDKVTKTESGELGSAVNAYIERIRADRSIVPSFNTFYEYMRDDYRRELAEREIKVEKSDFNIDNMLTTMRQYYRGGRYDFLLNSTENIDLLNKRFIVFEIDSIKENRELFPVVTIIIMEAFINKMRRLKGVRKQLIVEEAWKALSSANMAEYLRYMYKTVRKYYGEAIVVTQEVDDIISSPVVKESIINNSDCKILLDQRKYMNKFDSIQSLLGLTGKGEVAGAFHQYGEQSVKALQGGVDRSGRHTVGCLCHRGKRGRIPRLYHGGNGEGGGVPSGGTTGRRHRSRHPTACRETQEQGITKKKIKEKM